MNTQMAYYQSHSDVTEPREFRHYYQDLPNGIPELCQMIQNLIYHYADQLLYGYPIPLERYSELHLKTVTNMLRCLLKRDSNSLTQERSIPNRLIGVCRDNAVLLCSILRELGIAARLRLGFINYLLPSQFLDCMHVEYWCAHEQRWCLIDVRVNETLLRHCRVTLDFDCYDIPPSQFITAEDAWRRCRLNPELAKLFGSRTHRGLWYIRNCLIKQLHLLIKHEVTHWELWPIMMKNWPYILPRQLKQLDKLSEFLLENSQDVSALQHYLQQHSQWQQPKHTTWCYPFDNVTRV